MIVKPTVKELLEHAENRYALVIATSRRARQIAKGDTALTNATDKSPVTIATKEIAEGKIKIYSQNEMNQNEENIDTAENEENTESIENIEENQEATNSIDE